MQTNSNSSSHGWLYYLFWGAVVVILLFFNYMYFYEHTSSNSEVINDYSLRDEDLKDIRVPAVAGLFYPADVYQLSDMVDNYLAKAKTGNSQRPHIIVVPHAGYKYSAQIAASAYKKLLPFREEIKKVILVGPSHFVALQGIALSPTKSFKTVLGNIPTDAEISSVLSTFEGFSYNEAAHKKEHSLEVQLPFLQKVLHKFSIVPLVYGDVNPRLLADALKPFINRDDVLIVVSADLSHYLDYDTAKVVDGVTIDMVAHSQALQNHQSCGAIGINAAILLAKDNNLHPKLIDIANSGDVTGDHDSVVGYASWVFDKKDKEESVAMSPLEQEVENLNNFARHNGAKLIEIAQTALEQAAKLQKEYRPSRKDFPEILFNKGAAFVTLTKNGELRGCIGSLMPRQAIALDIAANTFAAAMEDSRFSPVTADELPSVDISVSLLSSYEPINYADEADLLSQLQPGVDGLVIRDGDRQGLFLPSVWKQLPDSKEFLNNLKIKAGLSPAYWSNKIKAYRFRVVEIKKNAD